VTGRRFRFFVLCAALALGTAFCARRSAPRISARPSSGADPYSLRLGKTVFVHYCRLCHGETGAGDGFNAFNLDPRPRDLSEPKFQTSRKDSDLADAIRRGGAGVGLSPLMPPWGHTLTDRQIADVIAYIRSLRKTG